MSEMSEVLKAIKENTVLVEEVRDQNKALLEYAKEQATKTDIRGIEDRLDSLEADVDTIKLAVKAMSRDAAAEKRRLADFHYMSPNRPDRPQK